MTYICINPIEKIVPWPRNLISISEAVEFLIQNTCNVGMIWILKSSLNIFWNQKSNPATVIGNSVFLCND